MSIKISGVKRTQEAILDYVSDVQGKKGARAVSIAMHIVAPLAALHTPVDTSTLINSQYQEIIKRGTRVTGRIGYTANYALYVHRAPGTLKGKPRAHFGKTRAGVAFGGGTQKGNYWDPDGKPQFLTDATTKSASDVKKAVAKEIAP